MKFAQPTIVITDDDEDDKGLIVEALIENGVLAEKVILTSDGEELMKILPSLSETPCLVFLDLNMPRKDGRETLVEIKKNETLKHIPVIVFSTSNSKDDIRFAYRMGTNTYFTKPFSFQDYVKLIGVIKTYWFERAIFK